MTYPEPPESLQSDAALAEIRTRLVADGVIPAGPTPEQAPEPLDTIELQHWAANTRGIPQQLAAEVIHSRARIEELLAERDPDDEVLVEGSWFHLNDLPLILGNYMRSSDRHTREAKDALIELREARRWAAWFAAEAAYWKTEADLYHTVAGQNYENDGASVAALDAERTGLQARVDELSAGQGELIEKLSKASARVAELEAAQGELAGYAVTVGDETTGRFVQAGAVMSRAEADIRGRFYAEQGGRVVGLREVRNDA